MMIEQLAISGSLKMNVKCSHGHCNRDAIICYKKLGSIAASYCDWHSGLHGYCKKCGCYDPKILAGKGNIEWAYEKCSDCINKEEY